MGKTQRNKGATYERELASQINETLGTDIARNLSQSRDSGNDLTLGRFRIEAKRRAGIAVYDWLEQCEVGCGKTQTPIVIARADKKKSIVILRLEDFLGIVKTHNLHINQEDIDRAIEKQQKGNEIA